MMVKNPSKIHIIGSVGSGKTTLARTLSFRLNVPYIELDNVVWKRNKPEDIRRSDEERDQYLNEIISSDKWIVEGVHHTWVNPSFQNADFIILLDTDYSKRTIRIIKRFVYQKLKIEKANYRPTLKIFRNMFIWNSNFEKESKPKILKLLNQYDHKLIILKNNQDIEKYFN
ncbi:AAA family ATPase [Fictibacillus sp. WQ 8-8]|nr:AAA family ATPase [Fictibacillus sp. WQ 8-8]MCQ6266729.1 AAA family ATPase [Fictibacillus sp. WQ 8-8]